MDTKTETVVILNFPFHTTILAHGLNNGAAPHLTASPHNNISGTKLEGGKPFEGSRADSHLLDWDHSLVLDRGGIDDRGSTNLIIALMKRATKRSRLQFD